jgi:hypothetical protein
VLDDGDPGRAELVSCARRRCDDPTLNDDPIGGVGELLDPSLVAVGDSRTVEDDDHDRRAGDRRDRRCGAVAAAEGELVPTITVS